MKTKRGILGLFLALCVVWSMLPLGAFAADADEGAKHISTAAALQTIQNDLGGTYVLDNDIDLSSIENWTPIGASETPFTGTFDGQGHQITGLTVDSDSNDQGLFGYVGSGGTVKNVTVSGTVSGRGSNISVGGVVGKNSGTIENCHNTVAVSGSGTGGSGDSISVGGVVGQNHGGTIENCSNAGKVSGGGSSSSGNSTSVGGVVGYNRNGTVTNCYNIGEVNGNVHGSVGEGDVAFTYVGGVVGQNHGGTIENCHNTVAVSVDRGWYIGGVVGYNSNSNGIITNCYNAGNVSGDWYIGGVVGNSSAGTITNCYNTGAVSGNMYVGSVVGDSTNDTIENCYYLANTAEKGVGGSYTGDGVKPLTTEDFSNEESFEGWDFSSTWKMSEFLGRPILRSNSEGVYLDGSGTPAAPYAIPNLATLEYYRNKINTDTEGTTYRDANYVLTDDIAMPAQDGEGETSWTPIGAEQTPFTGTLDGQGHQITGLTVDSDSDNQGLFGYVGSGGTVKNLTVSGTVSGSNHVGGVVGENNGGTVENCAFDGSVSGKGIGIGGVVGQNSNGTVENCSNTGTVSGNDAIAVGGVAGWNNDGPVTNSYNTGEVSGTGVYIGGVVGFNNTGAVESCSNTGEVSGTGTGIGGVVGENYYSSTVTNCYSTGTVHGSESVGGVAGNNANSTVENSYNTGAVSGTGTGIGGVVGENRSNNANSNPINPLINSTIENCYNTGKVSGSESVGGVVGENDSNSNGIIVRANSTVTNCYSTGDVSGTGNCIGGVVGENRSNGTLANSTVENCYYLQTEGGPANGIGSGTGTAEPKTSAQFASGEVAWLLQDGQDSDIWGQTLTGETPDRYPVLKVFDADAPRVYRVTFAGVEDVPDQYVNENCKVSKPTAPTKTGYAFEGWYSDETAWNFDTNTVISDLTLTASWRQLSSDASVTSVTVKDTSGKVSGTEITVTLPAGSSLPTDADEITIEVAAGATYGDTLTTSDGGATWTFTVTAEDGTTTVTYTIQITVEQPAPDPEPETPVTPPAPPSGGGPSNPTYRPDIGTTENGEVDVSTTRPHAGDTVTVTPKPDDGYDVQTVTVTDEDGETVPVTKNEDGSFTFTQPAGEVTIDVAFTPHVSSSIEIQNGASVAIASPDDVIEIPQSSTFTVHFTSEKPLSDFAFLAGNGKAIATDTVSVWNPETREGTYTLYGLGAPGSAHDTTGIYVNGVKLFTMKVVPRPLTSDTTVDFAMSVGQTYQFWVKPDDPDANYTFNTANGEMLQTAIVKDAYPDEQGRYLCRLTVTGRGDTVGVYCSIDGNTYKLFTVDCR